MGNQNVKPLSSESKREFMRHLLGDIRALERMIREGVIESGITRIGAEQEYCLIGADRRPALQGPTILSGITDPHFTTELAQWNLEINLDPQDYGRECFQRMEIQLERLLQIARQSAQAHGAEVVLTGILPTIRQSDMGSSSMTPIPRYRLLDRSLKELRGENFLLYIEGVDEVILRHESILYESCNTSFQVHIQVDPGEFVDRYNWAQIIAGPVLSCCVNSPILLGRELWSETRIALFRQSIDVRHASQYLTERQSRVDFGRDWLKSDAAEIFRQDVATYPPIIAADFPSQNALEQLDRGEIPQLRAMNLHNGTVYKWNRPCYGIGDQRPHLRIENRFLPAGPTVIDEMANAVFWIGLMLAMPDDCRGQWSRHFWFQDVRANFFNAARNGLGAEMVWFGKNLDSGRLLLDLLLPLAASGLERSGLDREAFGKYLDVIEARIRKRQTGAQWIVQSLRELRQTRSLEDSLLLITDAMARQSIDGEPGHLWTCPQASTLHRIPGRSCRVDSVMSTHVVTVREDDLLELAQTLLAWNGFHHLPVENSQGKIIGVVSATDIQRYRNGSSPQSIGVVRDCMTGDVLTIAPESSLDRAEKLMRENDFRSLPVVSDGFVVGMITATDIRSWKESTNQE